MSILHGTGLQVVSLSWTTVGHMDDAQLESAMRLGDKNPLDRRRAEDLGRWCGLKTASFSQCRRLTVATRKEGVPACLRWDLDVLAAKPDSEWLLFEGPNPGSETFLTPLASRASGTLILWEVLDRIVTSGYTADDFNDLMDRVEGHLAMVFHRLLQGPHARLHLLLNGREIASGILHDGPSGKALGFTHRKGQHRFRASNSMPCLPHKDRLSPREFEVAVARVMDSAAGILRVS